MKTKELPTSVKEKLLQEVSLMHREHASEMKDLMSDIKVALSETNASMSKGFSDLGLLIAIFLKIFFTAV